MAEKLFIEDISLSDSYTCEVSFDSTFDYLFNDDTLRTTYTRDISDVPNSILVIPALANLVPLAWARGADIYISELDRTFYYALHNLQAAWKEAPVDFFPSGNVHAKSLVENTMPTESNESALLFSSGIDSLHSYVEHREERPLLVTTRVAAVALDDEGWSEMEREAAAFADEHDVRHTAITSNLREMIDYQLVNKLYRDDSVRPWWGGVQYGLGLLGLCAPLTITDGIGSVKISTALPEYELEPPVHPMIIEQVDWANTRGELVGMGVTRQEKVEQIVEYMHETGDSLKVRSCDKSEAGDPCLRCEKCARTFVGLLVAGADPREHGYDIDEHTLAYVRQQHEHNGWTLKELDVRFWLDIQNHIEPRKEYPIAGAREFLEWLQSADIHAFKGKSRTAGTSISKGDLIPSPLYPYAYRARKRYRSLK